MIKVFGNPTRVTIHGATYQLHGFNCDVIACDSLEGDNLNSRPCLMYCPETQIRIRYKSNTFGKNLERFC